MVRRFNRSGYAYLYRSLIRFCHMGNGEAIVFISQLRMANLNAYCREHPLICVEVPNPADFSYLDKRPYFTEVQLYKALRLLHDNLPWRGLTYVQQEEVRKLRCLYSDLAERFQRAFEMEIEDGRTVYADCADDLEPGGREPCVCLREHWCMNGSL